MKRLFLVCVAGLVIGCGSSNEVNLTVVPRDNPQPTPTVAPYVPLSAGALQVFGQASSDIFGRPTGAGLDEAIRFADIVSPLYDVTDSDQGPLGGTITVTPGTPKRVVFDGYRTSGEATINGTVLIDSTTGLQTYQGLNFLDAAGKAVTIDGTIDIEPTIVSPSLYTLVVTSNLKLDFGGGSILTLINHVSNKRVEGTAPDNYIVTFNDTAEVRIQQGNVDYHAMQTMPEPFVSEPAGPADGVILLTGIAPSRESVRLEVVENQQFAVYLQMFPNTPFMLIATI